MTSTIVPILKKLIAYDKVNVIDVGAARGSFMYELYSIFSDAGLNPETHICSMGIDPTHIEAITKYTGFILACVANVENPQEKDLYLHDDDQANSLCINVEEDGSITSRTKKVWVLNLNTLLESPHHLFANEVIHFLKIDAEGKDLEIVESLSAETLKRIKYISMECKNGEPRYEGDRNKLECINYMDSIGFDVCHVWNSDNESNISDVVFENKEVL
tara:strand:- start:913 stop:1563 length:651 start_codon:yes stop_codon:yes gene_type:complete